MFQRGDIVIFRPKEVINDEYYPKYGALHVGIVTDIEHNRFILNGSHAVEEEGQELLTLRVAGGFRPTVQYPDRLNKSLCCTDDCKSASFCWYGARREYLANSISQRKSQNDVCADFGRAVSSHITDLNVKFASLRTDTSNIEGLSIRSVETDFHVHRPSIFHDKIERAVDSFRSHWLSSILLKSFVVWQNFIRAKIAHKVEGCIIIQKYARRYLERDSLRKQRDLTKWWKVQREFWFDYVDPKVSLSCYNLRGTQLYFSTKFAADRWGDQLKSSLDQMTVYAANSVNIRLKEAIRRWKSSIVQQKRESELMAIEDISSSFFCSLKQSKLHGA